MTDRLGAEGSMGGTIVFDLDGTLADTAADMMYSLNQLLVGEGLPPIGIEQARKLIGAGARNFVARGFDAAGAARERGGDEGVFTDFMQVYEQNLCRSTCLFPGVIDALDALEGDGFTFAVCTNKAERQSRLLLDALGISSRFTAICGGDRFPWRKPDPRHLLGTVALARSDPSRAVMVGDSGIDIDTARAAAIPVIAVSFGYTERPVDQLGPDRVIDEFTALAPAVRSLKR